MDRTVVTRVPTQVEYTLEVSLRPNPLGKGSTDFDIGYEAAKRDLLWALRDVLGKDFLEYKV